MDNYENERRIKVVRQAFKDGKVYKVEFYSDGSGACFEYLHPTGDHGCPCTMASSFKIQDAMRIVAGFRLIQHELRTCM